jgi:hypothetical protein
MTGPRALFLLIAFWLAAACAPPPVRKKAAPPPPLSQEAKVSVDREFFQAVDAYTHGLYDECEDDLRDILSMDPNNADALALRRRLRAMKKAGVH